MDLFLEAMVKLNVRANCYELPIESEEAYNTWVEIDGDRPAWAEVVSTMKDVELARRVALVRNECQRRIMLLVGTPNDLNRCLIKQLNALMRATELTNRQAIGEELSSAEQAEAAALQSLADAIKALRAASNVLEADPPDDYADDEHWPS